MNFQFTSRELNEVLASSFVQKLLGAARRPARKPRLMIARPAFEQGVRELTSRQPEFSLLLLGLQGHPGVTHVIPDTTGEGTPGYFRIGAKRLNEVLRQYEPLGLEGKGFWHSHPPKCERLSQGDIDVVGRLFANPKNDATEVLMPIMSGGKVFPFLIRRSRPDKPVAAELVIF